MNETVMWTSILLFSLCLFILAAYFLINEISKLSILKTLSKNNQKLTKIESIGILILLIVLLSLIMSFTNCVIVLIHLCLFTIVTKLIVFLLNKKYLNYVIVISTFITCLYLGVSYYNLFNVNKVIYNLTSNKLNNSYKIAMFSDSHIGTSFSGKELNKYIDLINEEDPDVVVIVGDFIDDSTSKKDMEDGSSALGNLKTKYGVYYVFGNHDKGYYASKRGYDYKELTKNLEANNVTVLEDELALINDEIYIVGRADKSETNRKDIDELLENLDNNKYFLVLDHQPNDYYNEAKSQNDLVLSGHTHGGQMYPIGLIGELIGANDFTYGYKTIDNTNFIVSSGISDWELLFKSGCSSEYLIININAE